ncbi:hypothetical protein HN51_005180 [Arachis hypogaea]|uniref:Alpha 1,4-glycosyltransferase domain-containing protein n=1 Tax=Arachis hypogaea TaxID=3818 RepID=A0A445DFT4_ARAHY|nr:lactosylceramide 4-alpha-galactosyltransferase-like [Arachis hypogaea]XP_057756137.1 uncharacterized protein LOC130975345 [Arachis stenosperma]QHO38896.1 uncharacterized protein DS421_4g124390 [Arachis hypogaea]RYR62026.1 hypothetical protein Ahy_A04g019330 [Arachis hypogaea]
MGAKKTSNDESIFSHSRITKLSVVIYALIFVVIILFNSDRNINSSSSSGSSSDSTDSSTNQNQTSKSSDETNDTLSSNSAKANNGVNSHSFNMEPNTQGEVDYEENEDLMIPLPQMTKPQRIAWFRSQLPKLQMLKSRNDSSFHARVSNFFTQNCSTRFYAIWLSPAKFFGQREFMTMDTLLKVHPQGCLLILSSSMDSVLGYRILKPLIDRGLKVLAIAPDLPVLVLNTPAESWLEELKSGNKDPGTVPLFNNLSNLIRLAVLYKYGGVYLDIDLIFLKDLSSLRNAIGAQNMDPVTKKWLRLNNAVMVFDKKHPILLDFIEEFAQTFDGNRWGHNGPYMVSRVVGRVGNTPGYDITILPPKAFYPVDWNKIPEYYKKPEDENGSIWVENKVRELMYGVGTYTLHLWNKRTRKLDIEDGSVMARLFTDHCVVCYGVTRN